MAELPGRLRSSTCLWLVLLVGSFSLRENASAADSLASVAPSDTALFLEIPAPDAVWTKFEESELARRWQASPLSGLWLNSQFVQRWRMLDRHATAKTGETLTHHLRTLFADGVAVVVVLRDKTPTGLLTARAGSPDDVAAAIRAWDKLEPPLRVEPRQHEGRTYHARVVKKPEREQTIFYATQGSRFLLSDQESLVRDCLALWTRGEAVSLADQPEFQELLSEREPVARLYLSPMQWHPALDQLNDHTPGSELLLTGLRKLRGVMAVVTLDAGLLAEVTATLESDALSTGWRDFIATGDLPSIVADAPADALLVVGGRFATEPLLRGMQQLMADKDRQEWNKLGDVLRTLLLGTDPWTVVMPAIFSDWGGYLVVRPATDQVPSRSHPFVAAFTSRWPQMTIEEAGLENALSFGVNALSAALSSEKDMPPVSLQRSHDDQGWNWHLTGRSMGEFALQLTSTSLRWSSSRAELRQMPARPESEQKPLRAASREHFPNAVAFLWINARLFRTSTAPAALQSLAGEKEPPPLRMVNEISRLFDELFAALHLGETRIGLTIGARIAETP